MSNKVRFYCEKLFVNILKFSKYTVTTNNKKSLAAEGILRGGDIREQARNIFEKVFRNHDFEIEK